MSAVFVLTVRQLAGSRRIWLVLALVSLPLLAGLLFQVADATATPDEFADDVTRAMLASAILPLVMLLLATAAFGNEVGDRTLVYLVTKPIARWRIVAPKLLASVAVGGIPVALGGALAVAVIERWRRRRRPRDGRRVARGRGGLRGHLHVGGPGDTARAPDRARLRVHLGGGARRLPRRDPLPQRPPLHARARPRPRRRPARECRHLARAADRCGRYDGGARRASPRSR